MPHQRQRRFPIGLRTPHNKVIIAMYKNAQHAVLLLILTALAGTAAAPDRVKVISHRGEHLRHPENTLPAFEEAVRVGADYIEVDVRTTADGKLVLMHDSKVDRTTNGHGEVSKMTFEEIRKLQAGGAAIPTFDEALDYARGKIGVYVDAKAITAKDLVDRLRKGGDFVIYADPRLAKEVQALDPALKVMPEARSAEHAQQLIDELHPKVLAFDAKDFTPDVIAVAKKASVEIFVDRLGPFDNPTSWQSAIDQGAAGIQTDHPEELVKYLRKKP